MEHFNDIKIKCIDKEACYKSDEYENHFEIRLRLSSPAPLVWSSCFEVGWKSCIYTKKLKVDLFSDYRKPKLNLSIDYIDIECIPDDLDSVHLPEINRVIDEANRKYKNHLKERAAIKKRKQEEDEKAKEKINALVSRIKF